MPALNTDTTVLKVIAAVTMCIHHADDVLWSSQVWCIWLGRLAWPLFAYCAWIGVHHTHDKAAYLTRLLLLAVVSQPILWWAFRRLPGYQAPLALNAVFSIASVVAAVIFYQRQQYLRLIGLLLVTYFLPLDYRASGVILAVIWEHWNKQPIKLVTATAIFFIASAVAYPWRGSMANIAFGPVVFGPQIWSLGALPLLMLPAKRRIVLPRWLGYVFYPAHILVIAVLSQVI